MELETLQEYAKPLEVTIQETGGVIKLTYRPAQMTPQFERQIRDEEFTSETLAAMTAKLVSSWDVTERVLDGDGKPVMEPTGDAGALVPKRRTVSLTKERLQTVPSTLLAQVVLGIQRDMNPNPENSSPSEPGS